jgi:hypothetical protein
METRNRSKPATRSSSVTDSNAVADVTKFLSELSSRSTRSTAHSSHDSLKHFIEKRLKHLGKATTVNQRFTVSEEYIQAVEVALNRYVARLLSALVQVSLHRAGLTHRDDSEYMAEPRTTSEEWLSHKEDCCVYFSKIMNEKTNAPNSTEKIAAPPEFNKAEYSSHAIDEENKRYLTAQSVRRVSARDLIPLLMAESSRLVVPISIRRKLMNLICAHEINSEYIGRGNR